MPELYLWLLDRILTPVLFVLAVILLLVGHNAPGGGFIAGLVFAAAFMLQIITRGDDFVRGLIGSRLPLIMGAGLVLAVLSALIGASSGGFFKAIWWTVGFGRFEFDIGTPMFFDIGVFLVVLSVVTSYILELSRSEEERMEI